jgi:hypothetical protein
MNLKVTPQYLTAERVLNLATLKRHYPFRVVFGAYCETTGEWQQHAKSDRRLMNRLARQGWKVHRCPA